MGMYPRNGDYLTGMPIGVRPDRLKMATFLRPKADAPDNRGGQSRENMRAQTQRPLDARQADASRGVHPSDSADIVDLIQLTRNRFEKMIAVVRKRKPKQQKRTPAKRTDLEPLTGGIAHTFSNLFMAIQGRISLMLLRSGPAHPFFVQLKRMEKLVLSESVLANDILPHIAGRYFPLDYSSRRRLLDQISQIPLSLGVSYRMIDNDSGSGKDAELKPADFQKLTVAVTCILNLLLSEINSLTDFMMSQTASAHSDFNRLQGIKSYVQMGYDRIRELYEFSGLATEQIEPTRPQKLVEILFDTFFNMEPSVRLHISVAKDLWCMKADSDQVARIIQGLLSLAASPQYKGGDLHFTAANACGLDSDVKQGDHGGYVSMSIGVTTRLAKANRRRAGKGSRRSNLKTHFDKDVYLDGISGLIRSLGGRMSTICPPGTSTAFNIFLPALASETSAVQTRPDEKLSQTIVYVKSEPDSSVEDEPVDPCLAFYKLAYSRMRKTASSSI